MKTRLACLPTSSKFLVRLITIAAVCFSWLGVLTSEAATLWLVSAGRRFPRERRDDEGRRGSGDECANSRGWSHEPPGLRVY